MKLVALDLGRVVVAVPMVPNYIMALDTCMPVGTFTDSELKAIAEAWAAALLERAEQQRKAGRE